MLLSCACFAVVNVLTPEAKFVLDEKSRQRFIGQVMTAQVLQVLISLLKVTLISMILVLVLVFVALIVADTPLVLICIF